MLQFFIVLHEVDVETDVDTEDEDDGPPPPIVRRNSEYPAAYIPLTATVQVAMLEDNEKAGKQKEVEDVGQQCNSLFEKAGKQKEVEDVGQQCNKLEDNGEALKEVKKYSLEKPDWF